MRATRIASLNPLSVEGREHASALSREVDRGKDLVRRDATSKTCSARREQAHPVRARRIMREDENPDRGLDQPQTRERERLGRLIQNRNLWRATRDGTLKLRVLQIAGENVYAGVRAEHVHQATPNQRVKATHNDRDSAVLSHAPAGVQITARHRYRPAGVSSSRL